MSTAVSPGGVGEQDTRQQPRAMPKVSVIVAAFNAENYLREAIQSVLRQTFQDFELLIVDDGSTDGTARIIRSYSDARIQLVENQRNMGLTKSLNRALNLARGEYIARQDADDISEPLRLQTQVAYLNRHPRVALLGSWFTVIDENGSEVRRTSLPTNDLDLHWAMFFYCPFVHGAVMWRHAPVREQIGAYNENLAYAQDHDLWARIASRFTVANLPEWLVRYREHSQSMTASGEEWVGEGTRLQVDAVRRTLQWQDAPSAETEIRFRAMAALLRESQLVDLTLQQVRRGVDDVLALQSAMCLELGVGRTLAMRHRRTVRALMSRGLTRVSRLAADRGRVDDARQILATAYAKYWPTIGHRSAARLAIRLLRLSWRQPTSR